MHPNKAFRGTPQERNIAFARSRGFGALAVNADAGPVMSHIPFLISDDAKSVDLHLVRSNPICRMVPIATVIAVTGPDAYISPDWYDTDDQVPTWNYVSVHLRGTLRALPPESMRDMLERQSAAYEAQLTNKQPWTIDKMSEGVPERMMRMILPFRLEIKSIDGTWKLNQNKDDAARLAASEKVETGLGSELAAMAALMRQPPETT